MKRANAICLMLLLAMLLACGGAGIRNGEGIGAIGITPDEYLAERPTGKYDYQVVTVTSPFFSLSATQCTEDYYAIHCNMTLVINQRRDSPEGKQLFEILKDKPFHELTVDLSARDPEGVLLPPNHARVVKVH